jgi:hypothetical protein
MRKLSFLAIILFAAIIAVPARAQSPVGGALATLAAATAQADYARSVQVAAQTTRQAQVQATQGALSVQGTVQALDATRQAGEAQAIATSMAQYAAATATANAQVVQLMQAQSTATAGVYAMDGQATRQASENALIDAQADLAIAQRLGIIAAMLAMVFACYAVMIAQLARRRTAQQAMDQSIKNEWIGDGDEAAHDLPAVHVVDVPGCVEAVERVVEMETAW